MCITDSHQRATPAGAATYDEMCLAIVRYYPKQATSEECWGDEFEHANIGWCGITVRALVYTFQSCSSSDEWVYCLRLLCLISHLHLAMSGVRVVECEIFYMFIEKSFR